MEITGFVVKELYAPGSKSEREAVMIRTQEGQFLLQRVGGNPFKDEVLENLVGKRISGKGSKTPVSIILTEWTET